VGIVPQRRGARSMSAQVREMGAVGGRSGTLMTAVGAAVVAAAAVGDVLTPPRVVFIGLTLLGPLLASLAASWRQTAAVAGFAWVAALLLGIANNVFLTDDHLIRLAMVGMGGVLCVYAAAQRERRATAMGRLAQVAEVAQEVMLRPPPGVLGHVALAGRYRSASDEALVGGDLYETAFTPYGVRVVIGDVRGKGLEGVRLAASVLAAEGVPARPVIAGGVPDWEAAGKPTANFRRCGS
jgi:phosphoserine phosphatase RsbU/P